MNILLLPTSAQIDNQKELRTSEYLRTIQWIESNLKDYECVWLECVAKENSFIENYCQVFYSNSHNPYFRNKGANLGLALQSMFNSAILDYDMIVQFTGRYHFLDTYFFDCIHNNPGYDLYAMDDGHSQYFTGCFGMKTECFFQWVNETDWDALNAMMINIEKSLWNFAKYKKINTYELDSIHMDCNIFGEGDTNMTIR